MRARGHLLLRGLIVLALASPAAVAARDEGWLIERMAIRIDIRPDGHLDVLDAVDVDFRGLSRHGIYRDIRDRLNYDGRRLRVYGVDLTSVTSADGRSHQVEELTENGLRRFRIGDPDRTLSGRETYRIAYRIRGALNGFVDRDELYWNATGNWPVASASTTVVVGAPAGAIQRVACFQGPTGSTEPCEATFDANAARFAATRRLEEGEQLTIVVGLRKGVVAEPAPLLRDKPREFADYWESSPALLGGAVALLLGVLAAAGSAWWTFGRDRRFVSVANLSREGAEERVPLVGQRPVGVEFEPPDQIRPAQMGVLLDERADTLDVTATIVDLAVRGYLTITEIPKRGWFSSVDWQLDRLDKPDGDLLPYERIVLEGLFDGARTRNVSALKNKFYDDLAGAQKALYQDAVERGWFPRSPSAVRTVARLLGVLVAGAGAAVTVALGARWGAGLAGLPIVVGGVLLFLMAPAMPRRTATGRHLMKRTLGFVKFIRTGEASRLAFAERANIFSTYLPYAIVFQCVNKWARAFEDIDLTASTAGWYLGAHRFDASGFASNLGSFSSSISSSIASTPGGSGGSGFSGGSSGGGGGGGGGGSW